MNDPALTIGFYLLAAVTVISAVLVVSLRNIFHAVLFLVAAFVGIAGLYLTLNSPFLAGVQVLIYVGAIAVLTLFAVFMTRNAMSQGNPPSSLQGSALLVAVAVFVALGGVLIGTAWHAINPAAVSFPPESVAASLFTTYLFPFELASVLLLIAMIGAIVIARD